MFRKHILDNFDVNRNARRGRSFGLNHPCPLHRRFESTHFYSLKLFFSEFLIFLEFQKKMSEIFLCLFSSEIFLCLIIKKFRTEDSCRLTPDNHAAKYLRKCRSLFIQFFTAIKSVTSYFCICPSFLNSSADSDKTHAILFTVLVLDRKWLSNCTRLRVRVAGRTRWLTRTDGSPDSLNWRKFQVYPPPIEWDLNHLKR